MDKNLIINATNECSGEWGINHAKRLLHLISILGEGINYNEEAIWIAAYLHDWGAYQPYVIPGVEHYTRSTEVARDFLKEHNCPENLIPLVLECIEFHHGGAANRSIESKLFTDADALDLLGVAGTLKIFSMFQKDLKAAHAAVEKYKNMSIKALSTDKAKQLAQKRVEETEQLISNFEEETFGYF